MIHGLNTAQPKFIFNFQPGRRDTKHVVCQHCGTFLAYNDSHRCGDAVSDLAVNPEAISA